jgi:NADH-quinone oxidoreductase subunit H
LVVATLRVLSLQNAPKAIVIAFASSIVFIIMAVNIGFESANKKKAQAVTDGDNKSVPKFAVPSLPMEVSTINVSQKVGDKRE